MKIKLLVIITVIVCLSLSSCQQESSAEAYNPYTLNDFADQTFYNDIDSSYDVELEEAVTTEEFVAVENKYIEVWKKELNEAVQKLKAKLNENDAQQFETLQTEWEEQMLNCAKFDRDVLTDAEYDSLQGSSFEWLWLSKIREEYKERTVHIRYLESLLDN